MRDIKIKALELGEMDEHGKFDREVHRNSVVDGFQSIMEFKSSSFVAFEAHFCPDAKCGGLLFRMYIDPQRPRTEENLGISPMHIATPGL